MNDIVKQDIDVFLDSGKYLPDIMRDFHDQKDIFKCMYGFFSEDAMKNMPNWVDGHIFTIDFFLYFMAMHGYTLQRSRSKVYFCDLNESIADLTKRQFAVFEQAIKELGKSKEAEK